MASFASLYRRTDTVSISVGVVSFCSQWIADRIARAEEILHEVLTTEWDQ